MQTHSLDLESSSTQYASVADASQTGLDVTGDLTIEAWVKFETLPSSGNNMIIASKYGYENNQRQYAFVINNSGGTYRLRLSTSTNGTSFTEGNVTWSTPTTAVWYHVAVSKSSTTATMYVNGSSIGTATVDSSQYNGTAAFAVGILVGGSGGTDSPFDGLIKDVRVFNDARTSTEIIADMHTATVSDANLKGEWNLNNSYADTSGNSNTLTASGSPVFTTDIPSYSYLTDTFDRANSGSWGTRSDGRGTWSTIDAGSGYGWSVTSNTGRITGNWNGQRCAYTGLILHNNIKITFDFTTSAQWELSGGRAEAMYTGVKKGTTGQGSSTSYGICLLGDNSGSKGLRIMDSGTEKASASFATTNSTLYHIEIDINSNYHMDVYVYTGSKPGTPTLSFTNGGSAYTPTASGSNFGLEYAPNESSTGETTFDSLLIDTPSTNVTASPSVLSATFSTQAPSVSGGALVSPNALTATFSVQSATELIDEFFTPAQPVTATFSIPVPNIITPDALVNVSVLSASFSVQSPTASGGASVPVGVLTATFSQPTASFRGDFSHSAGVQSATFSVQAPTITAIGNVTVSPSAVAATFSLQSPTVTAEQNAMVAVGVLTATFTIPATTVTAIRNVDVSATTLVATFSIPKPLRKVGGLWTAQPREEGVWTPQARAV